ncbi:uncharacterized protein PAC_15172 [Phialocephala subalpina]|uniref:SET domain-containing protein n=1 Tax=Phialocephala subalpina TaxID=576137 RepID=A0A1L7XJQ1_9HELO|nr:uncharacterized protein PAC_15172 [Phialocephala subalpina]
MSVHVLSDQTKKFHCDYTKCQRRNNPFTRKDYYRKHLRQVHKEDLGCANRGKKIDKNNRATIQQAWLADRKISSSWWRCEHCLLRRQVKDSKCGICKIPCGQGRIDAPLEQLRQRSIVNGHTNALRVSLDLDNYAPEPKIVDAVHRELLGVGTSQSQQVARRAQAPDDADSQIDSYWEYEEVTWSASSSNIREFLRIRVPTIFDEHVVSAAQLPSDAKQQANQWLSAAANTITEAFRPWDLESQRSALNVSQRALQATSPFRTRTRHTKKFQNEPQKLSSPSEVDSRSNAFKQSTTPHSAREESTLFWKDPFSSPGAWPPPDLRVWFGEFSAQSCEENRAMFYECNTNNCLAEKRGEHCTNRAVAALRRRPNDNKFEVFKTTNRGYGLRTKHVIAKEEMIIEYKGELVSEAEKEARENTYIIAIGQGLLRHKLFLDAYRGNSARFVGHSCDPNCRMEQWVVGEHVCVVLVADKDISSGEELCFDYQGNAGFDIATECRCGSPACRSIRDSLDLITRPPYSYLQLIRQAIFDSKALSVAEIHRYITTKYPYYRRHGDTLQSYISAIISSNKKI